MYYPRGLCCHGDYVYICDRGNMRIQILTSDFEYSNSIQRDDLCPLRVLTSETTIGVSSNGGATLFFDLETRALKYKHNNYATYKINYIVSTFYGSNHSAKIFYLFDSDGNFIEEMAMNENLIKYTTSWHDGSLSRQKNNLYLVSGQVKYWNSSNSTDNLIFEWKELFQKLN